MDFTCPYCAQLVPVTDSVLAAYPEQVSLVFQHFPLGNRELSVSAAMAAECAREQGTFVDMYRALYERPAAIGEWEWSDFAQEANVPLIEDFEACMQRPEDDFESIASGRSLGEQFGVRGTPTVWLNGHVVTARSVEEFRQAAGRLLEIDLPPPGR